MKLSYAEENYLKAIYRITKRGDVKAGTNDIAADMNTKASSVTDMLKKLSKKELIVYRPYNPVSLTEQGKKIAILTIRKHRLWEVFLVNKLGFKWDEVHEIAEELEHIHSEKLIDSLDEFLNYPTHDPHGDPIPNKDGEVTLHKDVTISNLNIGQFGMIIGLKDSSASFLQYLDKTGLNLGKSIRIDEINDFDGSMKLTVNMTDHLTVSRIVAGNIYIKKVSR